MGLLVNTDLHAMWKLQREIICLIPTRVLQLFIIPWHLKKDLRSIEAIMISHGHYDHTGGLPAVLQIKGLVDVYGHPEMFAE